MAICKECKYFTIRHRVYWSDPKSYDCMATATWETNFITGEQECKGLVPCISRNLQGNCKWYKSKEETRPIRKPKPDIRIL